MNQYNRLLDPKKDIGRYSGAPCHLSLGNDLGNRPVGSPPWIDHSRLSQKRSKSSNGKTQCPECLGWYSLPYLYFHLDSSFNAYRKKALRI